MAATRSKISNNLKRIGAAILAYQKQHGRLPPAAVRSPDGKSLLSWRVAILPHLGHGGLYDRLHLDESWDSPHNLGLLNEMPDDYRQAGDPYTPPGLTYFQVLVGPGTAFERDGLVIPRDFPDGAADTLLVVEAAAPVAWTRPTDVPFHPDGEPPVLGPVIPGSRYRQLRQDDFLAVLADGSVRSCYRLTPASLRAAITRNGKDKLGSEW
jgi:hypothetical protein